MSTGDSNNQGENNAAQGGGTLLGDATAGGDKKPADTNTPPAEPQKTPQTTDNKDAKGGEGKDAKDGDKSKAKDGAPEKYEDFKMPEGVEVDKAALEKFTPLAKELNLSQDNAQKLVDFYAKAQQEMRQQHMTAWNDTIVGWQKAVNGDKEYGGAQLKENLAHAARFRDQFGTPELTKALNELKIGDHPEMVRLFVRAGKAMADDSFRAGRTPGNGGEQSRAEILYPNSPK